MELGGHWINFSDLSGNGRNASFAGQEQWEGGHFGDAFTFTGNDHLYAPDYKAIGGTDARTLSLWVKSSHTGWRTLAYWGNQSGGQRWWVRYYMNEFQVELHGAVRRTFTSKTNDGVWHYLVSVLPAGKRDRNDILLLCRRRRG